MIKLFVIFIAGVIETWLYTGWALTATQKKVWTSSILMFFYMTVYLFILDAAFKDSDSKLMILTYAFSCGVGNFLRVYQEAHRGKN